MSIMYYFAGPASERQVVGRQESSSMVYERELYTLLLRGTIDDYKQNNKASENNYERSVKSSEIREENSQAKISTPAIAGIAVFVLAIASAACMFYLYRRKSRSKSGNAGNEPAAQRGTSQVVQLSPVAMKTSTYALTSQASSRPIPAAPDYVTQGMGRRLSRDALNVAPTDTGSSEEEQYFDANEETVVQKYDWSGSSRETSTWKKKTPLASLEGLQQTEGNIGEQAMPGENPSPEDEVDSNANLKDDEMIDYPRNHIGRIWFRVDYQSVTEKLNVKIFKVRNLPARDTTNSAPDPQVRLYLLPDDRCQHQTETRRKTCNPNFGGNFNFQVARDHLRQRALRLSVYDQDKGHRGDVIGHVLYSLKDQEFGEATWRDLETLSEVESTLGDLHVSLAYYPVLDRLTVIVLRGANLPRKKGKADPDTYVKVTFSKGNNILKVKKTGVKYATTEPFYNESFNISTTVDDLPTCTLLLSVYQNVESEEEDGKLIGRVLLGGMMYARGKELEHWTEMICQPRAMIKYWHPLNK